MYSKIFHLNLISPYQELKEVEINSAFCKLDQLLYKAALDISDVPPHHIEEGDIILIPDGMSYKSYGKIYHCEASNNQMMYVLSKQRWYIFQSNKWEEIKNN